MATKLARGYQGGPLADYSQSFTGLRGFYDLQKPGATQHERMQNVARAQQSGAGGFSRVPREPVPSRPSLAGPAGEPALTRPSVTSTSTGVGVVMPPEAAANEKFSSPLDTMDEGGAPRLVPGAVPAGGRSMTDPSRIMETVARGNRRDPRTQAMAAGFFQSRQDAAAAGDWQSQMHAWEREKEQNRQIKDAAETRRQQLASAGYVDLGGPGAGMLPTETARHNAAMEELRMKEWEASQNPGDPGSKEIPGTKFVIPYVGNKVAGGPLEKDEPPQEPQIMETFPGSGVYRKVDPSTWKPIPEFGEATLTKPGIKPFMVGKLPMPGAAPKFSQVPSGSGKPLTPIELLKQIRDVDAIIDDVMASAEAKDRARTLKTKLMQDFDGNGVPDAMEAPSPQGGTGGAAPRKPSGGFLNAVK